MNLVSALIGGFVSLILYPVIRFFVVRGMNSAYIKINIDEVSKDKESNYETHNLRLKNYSWTNIKELHVYVEIRDLNEKDILFELNLSPIKTFVKCGKVDYGMLSWSKNVNNSNLPNINLNQGETADINFIRYHKDLDAIEIASEQGFSDTNKKSRILLKNRNFEFIITLTGENIFHKKHRIKWDAESFILIEINNHD
jgi:hypothetical protein